MTKKWVVIVCMCTLAAKFVAEIAVLERRHPVHATPTVAPTPSTRYHEYRDRRTAPTVEMVTATAKVVPASNKTEEDVLILVLSRRPAFETRTTIRETWGKGCTNIRFVVGSCCRLPQSTVQPWTCIPHAPRSASQQEVDRRTADCVEEDRQLERERNQFNDMVFARTVDVYRHLPQKLKEGYQWAMQNSLAEWIIKTDDDSVVRVKALTKYLRTTLDASVPTVYGSISKGWGVHRAGKWAERTYAPPTYPAFPLGSHGHVVSRPVAQWIADNQHGLINYQGEDVSIGIWLDGSPLKSKVKWVASKHTANHGNCFDPSLWMIGHDISAAKMRKCFGAAAKSVSIKPLGRLGNLMFEHASAYGLAQQANVPFCIDRGNSEFSFSVLRETFVGPFPPYCTHRGAASIAEAGYAMHDARIAGMLRQTNTPATLNGYFQSWRYFEGIAPAVRSLFTFKPDVMAQARTAINRERNQQYVGVVGIHVRRGDYMKYGYLRFPPASYFESAMVLFPRHQFIVLTEDIAWCREQLFFMNNAVKIMPAGRAGPVDMAILSLCDGIILTLGTFGWWGGWLANNARVVYYANVFKLEHPTNKGKVQYEDHFLPGWTAIPVVSKKSLVKSSDKIMQKGEWEGSPIVLRKYKLVFWTIPKNSCEEFKRLFRRMEGYADWRTRYNSPRGYAHDGPASTLPHDPSQNGLTYLYNLSAKEATTILNDETWIKALFWRDPMERFVSAYLDKIVKHPYYNTRLGWDFKLFVSKVENGKRDVHWNPQCELYDCNKWMPIINFMGHIETAAEDTERLLRQIGAWEDFGANGWGVDKNMPIFQGKKHATHTTGAHERMHEFYADGKIRQRVKLLMATDLKQIIKATHVHRQSDSSSGATGKVWIDARRRSPLPLKFQHWTAPALANDVVASCTRWGVVTTINAPTEAVQRVANDPNWCTVVVGDIQGPDAYDMKGVVFLNPAAQRRLSKLYNMIDILPWRHFGRKNVGYLYAIAKGARLIYDFDDDNVLHTAIPQTTTINNSACCTVNNASCIYNPYPAMGSTADPVAWPRGMPLVEYHNASSRRACIAIQCPSSALVLQSVANNDPDVDSVYRLTRALPFDFRGNVSVVIPKGVFSPYNAQASLHAYDALWALLLPITVPGRVSDIWRAYLAQPILWSLNATIAFVPPIVTQNRNAHNYMADFEAEQHLFTRSSQLLTFLGAWHCPSIPQTVPACIEQLWAEAYERDYLQNEDVLLMQRWIDALLYAKYNFPRIN